MGDPRSGIALCPKRQRQYDVSSRRTTQTQQPRQRRRDGREGGREGARLPRRQGRGDYSTPRRTPNDSRRPPPTICGINNKGAIKNAFFLLFYVIFCRWFVFLFFFVLALCALLWLGLFHGFIFLYFLYIYIYYFLLTDKTHGR